eukprot:Opistho-2@57146
MMATRAPALVSALLILCISAHVATAAVYSILDYGAIPNDYSSHAAETNSMAIKKALYAANMTDPSDRERVALVPESAKFYIVNTTVIGLTWITLRVDGTLILSDNRTLWAQDGGDTGRLSSLYFEDIVGLTITGNGVIDGQGYNWWWHVILTGEDNRPSLIYLQECTDIVVTDIRMRDSPLYHLYMNDIARAHVRNVDIRVDVTKQRELLGAHGLLGDFGIPTFPLNTDGIDPAGIDVLIENVTIVNFDDAVAVKPSRQGRRYSSCSSNITVRDAYVEWGVGMTIGSVPPNPGVNCVRNVTFERIRFKNALKAIYIKSNPGTAGTGIIDDITYRDIRVEGSLWYPIFIGPQQQKQPHSSGTGCSFFYPIVKECPTQPRVAMSNIHLENVELTGGLLLPGVILCNATQPCTGFTFKNVTNTGTFLVQKNYVCENVVASTSDNSKPSIPCFTELPHNKRDEE